jgi:hypothetical protein
VGTRADKGDRDRATVSFVWTATLFPLFTGDNLALSHSRCGTDKREGKERNGSRVLEKGQSGFCSAGIDGQLLDFIVRS